MSKKPFRKIFGSKIFVLNLQQRKKSGNFITKLVLKNSGEIEMNILATDSLLVNEMARQEILHYTTCAPQSCGLDYLDFSFKAQEV